MRLLFVGKRSPQQRDLIKRPYGRFHYLPRELATLGHAVEVLLLSHDGSEAARLDVGNASWSSQDIRALGPRSCYQWMVDNGRRFQPDWVIGVSDAWTGWLAAKLARKLDVRLALDAYDNFESYMPWNLPLHWLWRRALGAASLVTAAGPQLSALMARHHRGDVPVVPMAADPGFFPREMSASRSALGIPPNAPVFGYFGGWTRSRGIEQLAAAFGHVNTLRPESRLVVSGNPPQAATDRPGIIRLGYLPDDTMPVALTACNVACVVSDTSAFGSYSYPAKLYEALACQVPVVATATAPIEWIMQGQSGRLVAARDSHALADAMVRALSEIQTYSTQRLGWPDSALELNRLLTQTA